MSVQRTSSDENPLENGSRDLNAWQGSYFPSYFSLFPCFNYVAIIWTTMTTELRWRRTKTTSVDKKLLLSVSYCHETRTTEIGDLSRQLGFEY